MNPFLCPQCNQHYEDHDDKSCDWRYVHDDSRSVYFWAHKAELLYRTELRAHGAASFHEVLSLYVQ